MNVLKPVAQLFQIFTFNHDHTSERKNNSDNLSLDRENETNT